MGALASVVTGDSSIEVRDSCGLLRLDWTGRSNARQPGLALGPWFAALLLRARVAGAGVEVHFEQLEFFNSSTISATIQFIREAQAQGVPLVFVFDGELKWQALTFEALRTFELPDGLLQIRATTRLQLS
ncbi:MAG: hypothetical protein Q8L48_38060 [Archangium sp.]|nr:hypothetical protein [Archangium sp.]